MRTVTASPAAGAPPPHRGARAGHDGSVQERKYEPGADPVRAVETHSGEAIAAVKLILVELKG